MDMLEKAFPSRRLAPPPPSAAGAPSAGAPSGAPAGAWGALAAAAASGGVRERVSWRFGMPLPEMMTSLQFWDEPSHQQTQQGGGARPAADELPSIDQLASEASVAELITMAAGLSGEAASRALAVPRGEIIRWMHALALPFALLSTDDEVGAATARTRPKWLAARKRRAQSAPARRRTPFDHIVRPADVAPSFASGALLCVLVERLKGPFTALEAPNRLPDRISGLDAHPRTFAARVANFDAALGALREDAPLPRGQRRWLATNLAKGDTASLWSLLRCLYARYPQKASPSAQARSHPVTTCSHHRVTTP